MIDPNEFLTPLDFLVAPFVLAILYLVARRIRDKHYPVGHPWRPYFLPALTIKFIGAILIGLIYAYYYRGGDTFNYHFHARVINSALGDSLIKWFNLLFSIPKKDVGEYYEYTTMLWWYGTGGTYITSAITAFLSAPVGSLYLPTALIFAFLSFSGAWALFRTFAKQYPALTRQVAIATLFIPSVVVWGSSIFKDTISLFALGWLTYGTIQVLAYRNFRTSNIILTVLSFILVAAIKLYIVISLMPPILLWASTQRIRSIRNLQFRRLTSFFTVIILFGAFGILLSGTNEVSKLYSAESIAKESEKTRGWISYVSNIQEGSAYNLGEFDPSIQGMITKFPAAVNVTLFRPYIWESRKVIIYFSALESLLILMITIKVLISVGIKNTLLTIFKSRTIQFCLIFSLAFAFAVGISTFNFGTLSRYKIPCIPFYVLAILFIYYENKPLSKPLIRPLKF